MSTRISLVGKRFGRLIVIDDAPPRIIGSNSPQRKMCSLCLCDCGNKVVVLNTNLTWNNTTSCGCFFKEFSSQLHTTHGKSSTRTYNIWLCIIQRCTNPNHPAYGDYGGRGITICKRWLTFENFLADMGECPVGLTIERLNNDTGNYEPENCVWATRKTQCRNQRTNINYTVNGITACLSELCEMFNQEYRRAYMRVRKLHWPIERALFDPKNTKLRFPPKP